MPATNRLISEVSPYLLQHAHNPVSWYPWGEEAFATAKKDNKPIFLSIGYSTCHWCHVMERESFENQEVANFLNEHFISIKVDREERPDVDKIYMTAVQAMSGQGGWPLSAWLTPEGKPFYGGTYFPPTSLYGRPGFLEILGQLINVWKTNQREVHEASHFLTTAMNQAITVKKVTLSAHDILSNAGTYFKSQFDSVFGGFGPAPKFPRTSTPLFLLRYADEFQDAEAMQAVAQTCKQMFHGGIYDQIGGGFHRYSVDEQWLVPHFEKMLYDNAQLLALYSELQLAQPSKLWIQAMEGIHTYLVRDMQHPEGGFYSAEDADSEGREGLFYVWTLQEMRQLLTPEELEIASTVWGVTESGNFFDHSDPEPLKHLNVLSYLIDPNTPEEAELLSSAKEKLFHQRALRERPFLDRKILTSWNGLLLSGYARAAVSLKRKDFTEIGYQILSFIDRFLYDGDKLCHSTCQGRRDNLSLLDDYAFLLEGVLDLYEATFDVSLLQRANKLADKLIELFYDSAEAGFWQRNAGDNLLIARLKESYDGAEPSGQSVAIGALYRLGVIVDNDRYKEVSRHSLETLRHLAAQIPEAVPYLLSVLQMIEGETLQLVITGDLADSKTEALIDTARAIYQPNRVIIHATESHPAPFVQKLAQETKTPTAYFCVNGACRLPVTESEELRKQLRTCP